MLSSINPGASLMKHCLSNINNTGNPSCAGIIGAVAVETKNKTVNSQVK
jgi:hypothetical protein